MTAGQLLAAGGAAPLLAFVALVIEDTGPQDTTQDVLLGIYYGITCPLGLISLSFVAVGAYLWISSAGRRSPKAKL